MISALSKSAPPMMVCFGEAMLELSHHTENDVKLGFGGDALNTAIYLARLGFTPHFMSALGQDQYSDRLMDELKEEGVVTDLILRHGSKLPGLYAINTDENGEREFNYWRENSAMRDFFKLKVHADALKIGARATWFYTTGITLSRYTEAEVDILISLASTIRRNGGHVVFDPNYRPALWQSAAAAKKIINRFAEVVDITLPSIEDENLLFGPSSPENHARRWHKLGVETVICKLGREGALISEKNTAPVRIRSLEVSAPLDTTGAGDSFNAAVIAGLIRQSSLRDGVKDGHALAAKVICHSGAILPCTMMPNIKSMN